MSESKETARELISGDPDSSVLIGADENGNLRVEHGDQNKLPTYREASVDSQSQIYPLLSVGETAKLQSLSRKPALTNEEQADYLALQQKATRNTSQ